MGLILTLAIVSILLVMIGIAFKGILWVTGLGALLLLATFVMLSASSRSTS